MLDIPNNMEDKELQDRFNRQIDEALEQILAKVNELVSKVNDLEQRVTALENP